MTLLAEPSQGGRQPVLDWPLTLGVRALGGEPTGEIGRSGSPICLYGDDAAVFALTEPSGGTNLTVDDGEEVWDLHLRPHVPGYHLQGDPCDPPRWPSWERSDDQRETESPGSAGWPTQGSSERAA